MADEAPIKFVPVAVSVTGPDPMGTVDGDTLVIVGAPSVTENSGPYDTVPADVTIISAVTPDSRSGAGIVAVIVDEFTTVTALSASPFHVTVDDDTKL
jgi:hypothetical protein